MGGGKLGSIREEGRSGGGVCSVEGTVGLKRAVGRVVTNRKMLKLEQMRSGGPSKGKPALLCQTRGGSGRKREGEVCVWGGIK